MLSELSWNNSNIFFIIYSYSLLKVLLLICFVSFPQQVNRNVLKLSLVRSLNYSNTITFPAVWLRSWHYHLFCEQTSILGHFSAPQGRNKGMLHWSYITRICSNITCHFSFHFFWALWTLIKTSGIAFSAEADAFKKSNTTYLAELLSSTTVCEELHLLK